MEFKEVGTINQKGVVGKRFDTDAPISIDSMIEILKGYENENTKLFECRCSTFTESGNPVHRSYKSVDSLRKLHNSPNPSVSAIAVFIDPKWPFSPDANKADKDNEIARKRMYEFIAKLEEDDGLFWEMSDINAMKLFEYAGYTKREDLIKVYANIRSKTRYQEYVERQKKIAF